MTDDGAIFLSYTAAKRFERCGFLQWAHKTKQVKRAPDEKPFFVGRVVHTATETFMVRRGQGVTLPELIPAAWVVEEAEVAGKGTVIWGAEERQAAYAKALAIAATLETMLRSLNLLDQAHLELEPKFRIWVGEGSGMYANPDILCTVGTVGYLGELKSGSSYDPDQVNWYVAVIERQPQFAHITTWVALPIRPAVAVTVTPVLVDPSRRQAQIDRVRTITSAMHAGQWDTTPGFYCSTCEASTICPSYQATYGHLTTTGRVGLAPL